MPSLPSSPCKGWRAGAGRAIVLAVVLLATISAAQADAGAPLVAGVFSPPRPAPEFVLDGSNGQALKLSDHRGKVVVLAFGFTSCADVCPITLAVLAQARKKLGPLADRMQIVYVTVDPERDDVAHLHRYLATFDKSFIGGTGDAAHLKAVRDAYGILASKKVEAHGYTVAHSSYAYLIDADGLLRALMPFGHSADDYAHDVGLLLTQRATAEP